MAEAPASLNFKFKLMKIIKTIFKILGYILIAAGGGYAGNEVITTLMQ